MNEQSPYDPREAELMDVHYSNIRDNQIGGDTDGISPEQAEDIGYKSVENTADIIQNLPSTAPTAKKKYNNLGNTVPLRGESEVDTGNPIYFEPPVMLNPEEKHTGQQGVEMARKVLKDINPDNSGS